MNPTGKSALVGLNVDQNAKDEIGRVIKIPWKQRVKYLGVKVTSAMEADALTALNITPLIKEIA